MTFPLALLAAASLAAVQPAHVTSVEGITEYRLPNGLRILLYPEPSRQTVTVNITYLVGSAHEDYGETGAAHLLEHLAIKGSKRFPGIWQDLSNKTDDWNATTWFDRTNYYETFPASNVADLRWALEMEADRMLNARIEKRFLDMEMTVVRNEFEAVASDPVLSLQNAVARTMFHWLNYGHPTIGSKADIENIPIGRLQAFYKTHYQPDNAVLFIGGRFDGAQVLKWIGEFFAPLPAPTRPRPRRYTVEPPQEGERSVTLRRPGNVNLAAAAYHLPAASHPETGAALLLYSILAEGPYSRLHKALLDTGKAGAVKPDHSVHRERSWMFLGAEAPVSNPPHLNTSPHLNTDELQRALHAAVENLATTDPPTAQEVNRARAAWMKEFSGAMEQPSKFAQWITEAVSWGDWRLLFLQRDWVRDATPEQVRAVAGKYLRPSNRTSGLLLAEGKPDHVEVPAAPEITALVKDYKGGPAIQPGEAFDSTPVNIEARTKYSATPGGMKLALLRKQTRGASVSAQVTLRLGSADSLRGKRATARLTAAMLVRGTQKRSGQQLQEEFDRLKARVQLRGRTAAAVGLTISTVGENLPAVLRLVAEALREPAFTQADLDQLRAQMITAAEAAGSDSYQAANARLLNALSPYPIEDPRKPLLPAEEIPMLRAVTLDSVRKFHAGFYGSQAADLVAVGQFDADAVPKLAAGLFDGWKASMAYERMKGPFAASRASRINMDFPGQENSNYYAGLNTPVHYDHPDFVAAWLGTWLFGMGSGNGRLMKRVRIQEGLSYGTNSWLTFTSDEMAPLVLFAICAPQNLNKTEAVINDEAAKFLRDGFTAGELETGRRTWLTTRHLEFSKDAELASFISSAMSMNKTFAWHVDIDRQAAALTVADVTAVFRKYLQPEKLTVVRAGDLGKAGK